MSRRVVSSAGREQLARAVQIDHDWSLRFSSEDRLIEAVGGLSDDDLEAAYLLAQYLEAAIACVQIRRDGAARAAAEQDIAPNAGSTR